MMELMMPETDERLDIARRNIRMAVALRETNFAEVARKAGLSRNAVSQFVSKKTSISYSNLLRVCDVLQIPIGLLHVPDSMTEGRITLHQTLVKLPPHLAVRALEEVTKLD